jgi:hypothetical protein
LDLKLFSGGFGIQEREATGDISTEHTETSRVFNCTGGLTEAELEKFFTSFTHALL